MPWHVERIIIDEVESSQDFFDGWRKEDELIVTCFPDLESPSPLSLWFLSIIQSCALSVRINRNRCTDVVFVYTFPCSDEITDG